MVRRMILWGLALGAAFVVAQNVPDFIRYMKIRSM